MIFPDAQICAGNGLTVSNTADRARVKANASATPSNQQWSQNFASFYRTERDPFGRSITQGAREVLDETLTVAATHSTKAVIVWHTYEFARWRPAGMTSGDPRRHWVEFVVDKAGVVTVLPDTHAAAVFRGLVIDEVDAARF